MSSPVTKTPTKSERRKEKIKQIRESAKKMIQESEERNKANIEKLTEQLDDMFKDDEDEPEIVQEDNLETVQEGHEPRQLLSTRTPRRSVF